MSRIEFLGVVTARSGSKRIPQKNLKVINGRPLIDWTFDAAAKCKLLNDIYLSTDSTEIIESVSKNFNFSCFGLRDAHLATDDANSVDVVLDVLRQYESREILVQNIVLLQPTSPLRGSDDIDAAIEMFKRDGAKALQSYSPAECPASWLFEIESNRPVGLNSERIRRSQLIPPSYRINGAIYIIGADILKQIKTFTPTDSRAYIMPRSRGIDIDEQLDFQIAEFLLKNTR